MQSNDATGITFVNALLGRGFLNGVVNLTFGAFLFTPDDAGEKVEPDMRVAARMRMDVTCARHLHESLGSLLETVEAENAKALMPAQPDVATGKPN